MQKKETDFIFGMTDLDKSTGAAIRPSGGMVLFCEAGCAIVSANFKRCTLRCGDIVLIFPDTLFAVHAVSKKFRVRYIEMSPDLFDETTFPLTSSFFDRVYDDPIFRTSGEQREIIRAWHLQNDYHLRVLSGKALRMTVRNRLQDLFLTIESMAVPVMPAEKVKPISIARQQFNRFCRLLVENCYERHDVKFYADKLCVTPYYLSKITFKMLEMSPKEIIDRQIIMEMKHLLLSTDLSAKEIAGRFHFEDTSYMGRYFRRHTGMTPTEFRKQ